MKDKKIIKRNTEIDESIKKLKSKNQSKKKLNRRHNYVDSNDLVIGSDVEKNYVNSLEVSIQTFDNDFIKEFIKSKEEGTLFKDDSSELNLFYHRQLLMACSQPLSDGITADSIIESLGKYAGMQLVCPEFHTANTTALYRTMAGGADKLVEKFGEDSEWATRRDMLLKKANGGELPLTPKVTAMQLMGYQRHLYDALRNSDHDNDASIEAYEWASDKLMQKAKAQGLSADDINKSYRIMVGQMVDVYPEQSKYFGELCSGKLTKSDYHNEPTVDKNGNMKYKEVWSGEYETKEGEDFNGIFTPRGLSTPLEYETLLASHTLGGLNASMSYDDVDSHFKSEEFTNKMKLYTDMMSDDGFDDKAIESTIKKVYSSSLSLWRESKDMYLESMLGTEVAVENAVASKADKSFKAPSINRPEFVNEMESMIDDWDSLDGDSMCKFERN